MSRAVAFLLATSVLALAACGSSSSSSSTLAPVPTNTDAVAKARLQASACMRAQGIDIPDITPGSGRGQVLRVLRLLASYPQAKLQAAERACAPYIKQAFPNVAALSPAQRAQRRQQLIAFATCMRSHGINFPDPTTAAGNPAAFVQALQNLDTGSPAYKSVEPGCRQQALKGAGG